jgi:uncharacterized protein (TIGR04255 family)
MVRKPFKNPPLVEVIVDVRWKLKEGGIPDTLIDPYYKLLPGKLSDKLASAYPYHEELPQASIPDEISPYTVKHRFRCKEGEWPLVQLGPGILTVHQTKEYTIFDEFKLLAVSAVKALFEVYPKPDELKIQSIVLRYIDATPFDYNNNDVLQFLKDKMGFPISLPHKLFAGAAVDSIPRIFSWQSSFMCKTPKGLGTLKFNTGTNNGKKSLIWEQIVGSQEPDVPAMPQGFEQWISEAHKVTESWFLSLIKGSLEKEFDNG